ncbi:hypothetical protein DPMN_061397 [Dreissena polymorpha]|uniref:G-protein coupled receptors family 1 profile domain-containing protein n=1 Tax=Dreissena polymorpha TaxID=45954 RepID=A0A9D4C7N8_DREPO|nr:hypothetical protein DPMN_061397 [Dreissena polymorpha]
MDGLEVDNIASVTNLNNTDINAPVQENSDASLFAYLFAGKLICSLGSALNIINILVLAQKELSESPYVYLLALAVSDLTFLLLSLVHLISYSISRSYYIAFFNAYIFFVIGNICFNASVWLIVFITIERLTFVVRPLQPKPSRKKALISISVIVALATLINIPRVFCFQIQEQDNIYYPNGTDFRESNTFLYLSWFHSVIINFIPNITLILTNSVLIWTLKKAEHDRLVLRSNQAQAASRDQRRLTRMLVVIVIVFFFCTIPSAFSDDPISHALFGKGKTWTEFVNSQGNVTLIYVSNLLLYTNSAMNFVLYCAFNRKFRDATKALFWTITINVRRSVRNQTRNSTSEVYSSGERSPQVSNRINTKL